MQYALGEGGGGGGGDNSHILRYRMCHFFRVLFGWKINFWVYFVACNKLLGLLASKKFWVNFLALNKFLGQIVTEH